MFMQNEISAAVCLVSFGSVAQIILYTIFTCIPGHHGLFQLFTTVATLQFLPCCLTQPLGALLPKVRVCETEPWSQVPVLQVVQFRGRPVPLVVLEVTF